MSKAFPIIPEKVPDLICDLIREHCPISQTEIVDEEEDEEYQSMIYKYVGFIDQGVLEEYIPSKRYKRHDYRSGVVSLYEDLDNNVVVFWHENVLVVMVSTDEDQHEGVMNHYGDAAVLLKFVGNAHLLGPLLAGALGEDKHWPDCCDHGDPEDSEGEDDVDEVV